MATFAMAMSTACVVDIGSSKISVCCIDEGLMIPKSIQRKHYGGNEVNEMFIRLVNRSKGLHYFPRNLLFSGYHYHKQIIEYLKENYTLTEMDVGETVKTCIVRIKERINNRSRKVSQLQFNCSDSLLLAPQSLFYSQLISILQKIKEETTDPSEIPRGDPL
jgi:actin-related protein 8